MSSEVLTLRGDLGEQRALWRESVDSPRGWERLSLSLVLLGLGRAPQLLPNPQCPFGAVVALDPAASPREEVHGSRGRAPDTGALLQSLPAPFPPAPPMPSELCPLGSHLRQVHHQPCFIHPSFQEKPARAVLAGDLVHVLGLPYDRPLRVGTLFFQEKQFFFFLQNTSSINNM